MQPGLFSNKESVSRICLLITETWPGSGMFAYRIALFESGILNREARGAVSRFSIPDQTMKQVREFLLSARPSAGRILAFGRGWRDFVGQILPTYVAADLQITDLRKLAIALRAELKPRAPIERILQAFGLGVSSDTGDAASSAYEDLLWAVLDDMTRRNLTWADIPSLLESRVHRPCFQQCAFDGRAIETAPPNPGVYVMSDREGKVLYVGKSSNLRRRLGEYFRNAAELPPKIAAIRSRIHKFECHVVGSELEALLLEQRLIAEKRPELNTQRRVAEGAGIYQPPALPVAMICPSSRAGCAEIFIASCAGRAVQVRIRTRRAASRSLAGLLRKCLAGKADPPAAANFTDWGPAGNEICCRYFGRFRNRLQWLELNPSLDIGVLASRLSDIARLLAENPPEAGEFRLGES